MIDENIDMFAVFKIYLKQTKSYSKYVENVKRHPTPHTKYLTNYKLRGKTTISPYIFLSDSFLWGRTEEKYSFWWELDKKWLYVVSCMEKCEKK